MNFLAGKYQPGVGTRLPQGREAECTRRSHPGPLSFPALQVSGLALGGCHTGDTGVAARLTPESQVSWSPSLTSVPFPTACFP